MLGCIFLFNGLSVMCKLFKYIVCFLALTTASVTNAITFIPGPISVGVIDTQQPVEFVPVERITHYSLEIDAEKSFFI